ncbi:MAG: hypothetical protein ACRDV4_00405 [Acidimicrobiales bacterium]
MSLGANDVMGMVPDSADGPSQRVGLVRAGAARFSEANFDETLQKLRFAGSVNTKVVTFAELREIVGGQAPSVRAVVFHTGRCGSTLLMKMLGHDRSVLPVGEPAAVGGLHRYALAAPEHAPATYRAIDDIVVLLDRFAAFRRQRSVLKLASWETAGVAGLGAVVGEDVPVVVLHRPAEEVVASEIHSPPGWFDWMSGDRGWLAAWAPYVARLPSSASPEEIYGAVWASVVEAALALPTKRALFVSYADLVTRPSEALGAIASHIGAASWDCTGALSELSYYSKSASPDRFDPAKRHARPPLGGGALELVRDIVGDLPGRLCERDLVQSATKETV